MERILSVFEKELSEGGGGKPSRLTIEDGDRLVARLDQALRAHAAWSPICWRDDVRRGENFEAASIAAVDWEITHAQPFPLQLYQDADRFVAFVESLGAGDAPLPDGAHMTAHGVRLIWLLDRETTDPAEYRELVRRLCLDYAGDVSATNLAVGFTSGRHLRRGGIVEVANNAEC
jgi:hypothetical protein